MSSLANEVSKFVEHIRILKRIKQNTNRAFHEIEKSGHFSDDILSSFLPEEEYQSLDRVCEKPPTIIVIGQSCHAKVCLINELLGQAVLPSVEELDNRACWRMIRLKYGNHSNLSLVLPNSYELATALNAYECSWKSVPREDLELTGSERTDPALVTAVAEISINHALLQAGAQIVCAPNNYERIEGDAEHVFRTCCEGVLPIVLYAIEQENLSDKDIEELKQIRSMHPELSIFFVRCDRHSSDSVKESMTESAQHEEADKLASQSSLFEQLCDIGFFSKKFENSTDAGYDEDNEEDAIALLLESVRPQNKLIEDLSCFPSFLFFFRSTLQYHLVSAATTLNEAHNHVLGMFITAAFDMARDIIITPKRIDYALNKEEELYQALMDSASRKQEEIREVIRKTISTLSPRLLDEAAYVTFSDIELTENEELVHPHDLEKCVNQIEELVLSRLNSAVAGKLISSVEYLRDSYTGTLSRCLECLELSDKEYQDHDSGNATFALKQVLDAAYQVEVTMEASSSLGRIILEKVKQMIATLPGRPPPKVDARWKRATAQDMLESLSEARLARNICYQFKARLIKSHEAFLTSMRMLESFHSGRLEKTEEQRMRVRKMYAPKLARLALESLSLRDMVLSGMPHLGREIGRGQYGVVYSCEKWANHNPCAVKSVVPPDEKHWNDLAMEYYYTRSLRKHPRVVALLGSVIDYNYAGGSSPAVLLIMERLQRDLYQGIKNGLSYRTRLQVALDVVEGLRYLHSQGLVHRDIKLKNVLLDGKNRGKITDLGFCKPGAMMSGSIVGTPIHMAPELFTCRYDSSVDVYAFGILFWYICAGHVRLPLAFEQCASKDQLWNSVRKGMRPEHLSYFEDDCWELMEQCWNGEPSMRPMLGHIQPRLAEVLRRAEARARMREARRQETKLAQAVSVGKGNTTS